MSFKAKTDYFGLESAFGGNLVITGANEGKSASVAEVQGQDGSIILTHVYGEQIAPSNDFEIKAEVDFGIDMGEPVVTDGKSIVANNVSIATSAGSASKLTISGEQVQDGAAADCIYPVSFVGLSPKHHAQILDNAFTLSGDGCHLTAANYTASCTISKATKDGETITFDVSSGKVECAVTIRQVGAAAPTLTPGEGWQITAPLTESNPDSDFPTWTATLTKNLVKSVL